MSLKNFAKAIVWIRQNIDPEIGTQKVDILLNVALHDGIHQQELKEATGLLSGSVSRHLKLMGKYYNKRTEREEGLGLITQVPDPMNRRFTCVYLTPKGKQTIKAIEEILNAETD